MKSKTIAFPIDFFGPKELGQNIKVIRKMRRMTQQDLAKITNVSVKFISNVECGKKNAYLDKVLYLLRALDIGTRLVNLRQEHFYE
jgi:transcriptional regulator with XRE-family HTH domain